LIRINATPAAPGDHFIPWSRRCPTFVNRHEPGIWHDRRECGVLGADDSGAAFRSDVRGSTSPLAVRELSKRLWQGSNVTSKDTGLRVDMLDSYSARVGSRARRPLPFSEGDFLMQLGARVRATRLQREMSRRELAGRSGVSERYIAQIEAGKGNVSIVLLLRIVHAVNCE
jgi:DNA-binding XRE family transcriptional regulator